MSHQDKKLNIFLSGDNFFVWDASDVRRIREEFRIVGTLVGCLPRAPRQNVQLGLPLQLMKEEVHLLSEKGYADIVEIVYKESDVTKFQHDISTSYSAQVDLFKQERRDEMKRKLPDIIEGKKKKRNKLLEDRQKNGEVIDETDFDKPIELDPDTVDIPNIHEEQMLIQLHTVPIYRNKEYKKVNLQYPETEEEILKYNVYKYFWELGHYITCGMKFGGDYLVYPGDPSRFHSFFVVVCKGYNEEMSALDIITMGRLGTTVKKTVVICSLDDRCQVCSTSLQWTSIS
ncbi:tRNA-splicing endonuclease subunit Sen34 [Mactra antiquata]